MSETRREVVIAARFELNASKTGQDLGEISKRLGSLEDRFKVAESRFTGLGRILQRDIVNGATAAVRAIDQVAAATNRASAAAATANARFASSRTPPLAAGGATPPAAGGGLFPAGFFNAGLHSLETARARAQYGVDPQAYWLLDQDNRNGTNRFDQNYYTRGGRGFLHSELGSKGLAYGALGPAIGAGAGSLRYANAAASGQFLLGGTAFQRSRLAAGRFLNRPIGGRLGAGLGRLNQISGFGARGLGVAGIGYAAYQGFGSPVDDLGGRFGSAGGVVAGAGLMAGVGTAGLGGLGAGVVMAPSLYGLYQDRRGEAAASAAYGRQVNRFGGPNWRGNAESETVYDFGQQRHQLLRGQQFGRQLRQNQLLGLDLEAADSQHGATARAHAFGRFAAGLEGEITNLRRRVGIYRTPTDAAFGQTQADRSPRAMAANAADLVGKLDLQREAIESRFGILQQENRKKVGTLDALDGILSGLSADERSYAARGEDARKRLLGSAYGRFQRALESTGLTYDEVDTPEERGRLRQNAEENYAQLGEDRANAVTGILEDIREALRKQGGAEDAQQRDELERAQLKVLERIESAIRETQTSGDHGSLASSRIAGAARRLA